MHLTAGQREIKNKIEHSEKLNPEKLPASEWLCLSPLSFKKLARQLGYGDYTIRTLCTKLGVKRTVKRGRRGNSPIPKIKDSYSDKQTKRREFQDELLAAAKHGDKFAKVGLETIFHITVTNGGDA